MTARHAAATPVPAPETLRPETLLPETRRPERLVPELGMRRVQWVRISVSHCGVSAEVAGLAYRLPTIRPIRLHCANALIRAGAPFVVHRHPPSTGD